MQNRWRKLARLSPVFLNAVSSKPNIHSRYLGRRYPAPSIKNLSPRRLPFQHFRVLSRSKPKTCGGSSTWGEPDCLGAHMTARSGLMHWRTHVVTKLRVLRFLSRYTVTNGMLNGRVTQVEVSIPVYFALGGVGGIGDRRYAETKCR